MKLALKLATAGVALASLFTAFAQAPVMRVSVPFKFHAGDRVLPAGDYDVRVDSGSWRVTLAAADGAAGTYVPVMVGSAPTTIERGKLLFRAYGGVYFLNRVQPAGAANSVNLFRSRAEKEMMAKIGAPREIALNVQLSR